MKKILIFLSIFTFGIIVESIACTSAIITGKITPDGRPLLWKHRDTGEDNNRIQFFKGKKYDFLGLVNSPDTSGIVWAGTNSAGFSIINTASYNLKEDDLKNMDMEGVLMFEALSQCKNLEDFEKFLNNRKKPLRVEANFGVIDAEGGAAYYEVNNQKLTKVDANDPKIAPEGYLIYTNFSYTGRMNEGMGYIRFRTASDIISKQAPFCNITPQWIFNNLSRSFYHSLLGIDLLKPEFSPEKGTGWAIDQDFIPRKISTASIVFQGIKKGENPEMTIMWTILGYPPAGIAFPLWVKAGDNQPSVMVKSTTSNNAFACDQALRLKNLTFSLKRGNGSKYMNFNLIYNSKNGGYMSRTINADSSIFLLFERNIEKWRVNGLNLHELFELNKQAENIVIKTYSSI